MGSGLESCNFPYPPRPHCLQNISLSFFCNLPVWVVYIQGSGASDRGPEGQGRSPGELGESLGSGVSCQYSLAVVRVGRTGALSPNNAMTETLSAIQETMIAPKIPEGRPLLLTLTISCSSDTPPCSRITPFGSEGNVHHARKNTSAAPCCAYSMNSGCCAVYLIFLSLYIDSSACFRS